MDLLPADEVHHALDLFLKGLARTGMVSPQQLYSVTEVINGLLEAKSTPTEYIC
jgi:hypothetical protein